MSKPITVSIRGLSKRAKRRVVRRTTAAVMKDRRYRKALRRSEVPIPKEAAAAAAQAAVETTLGTGAKAVRPRGTALGRYAALVRVFAAARRVYGRRRQRRERAAEKLGYNRKTGLFEPKKAKRAKPAKRYKPYKPGKAGRRT